MLHLKLNYYSRRAILFACCLLISVGVVAAAYAGGGKWSEPGMGQGINPPGIGSYNNSPAAPQ